MRFSEITPFKTHGSWECGFPMNRMLRQIDEWQKEESLNIDPDFQRIHVWTEKQQSAWLEFMFRGGKTGRVIYLNNPDWNRQGQEYRDFVLVDGKQRLEAIRRFYAGELKVFGAYKQEFEDEPDMLRQSMMKVNINDLPTRADVIQWYVEFNSGGTPHTQEEINKALALLAKEKRAHD